MATMSAIPRIDPDVKHVGVSKLRELNATKLRENAQTIFVLQDNEEPLAVLLSYDRYQEMQSQFEGILGILEMFTDEKEAQGVLTGLSDVQAGRTRSFAQIKAALRGSNNGPDKKR